MNGADRIAAERQRQIEQEGFSVERDVELYNVGELPMAAIAYAMHAWWMSSPTGWSEAVEAEILDLWWPWDERWWKPSGDPIRNLEKAGALIAAEIDRVQGLHSAVADDAGWERDWS